MIESIPVFRLDGWLFKASKNSETGTFLVCAFNEEINYSSCRFFKTIYEAESWPFIMYAAEKMGQDSLPKN
jgi:hypothetical protein